MGSPAAGRAHSWHLLSASGSHPGTGTWHGADSAPSVILHVTDNRLNCLQHSNYLNKDNFSFAGVTEKSPQTKRTFGSSDSFLQIISGSIFLLAEHWDGSCKAENSEMQWVNQGDKQTPSLLSTAADYPACCCACSPCSFFP